MAWGETILCREGQAFFTLSLGIGAIAIFGSYIGKERALTGEAISITILDTFVAFVSGLIIFPSCFSFGVAPDSGPRLIFVTLPQVFNSMGGGRFWGSLFFIFLAFAALSTIIAVFENIISFAVDLGWSQKKAILVNFVLIIVLSLPCVLGFNVWSSFQPLGPMQYNSRFRGFYGNQQFTSFGFPGLFTFLYPKMRLGME